MKFSYLYGAYGTPVRYNVDTYKDKTRVVIATLLCCVMLFGIAGSQVMHAKTNTVEASPARVQKIAPPINSPSEVPKASNSLDAKAIQSEIDKWVSGHAGTYGVVVSDKFGNTLAVTQQDQEFYMASIYKLYVAYIAYQKIDSGAFNPNDPYVNDWDRGKCLDEMIRTSNNPCGEKMMLELGNELNIKLKSYGLTNTSSRTFFTTAHDATIVLARIQNGTDLSVSSRQKLLDSMIGQKYRDGMPKGLAGANVYDKVGFREKSEYHDVGIVKLQNGEFVIISIMSKDAGVNKVADLSKSILSAIE